MASIKLQIGGLKGLSAALRRAPVQVAARLDKAFEKSANELAGSARAIAPEKTGKLKAGIRAGREGNGWLVESTDEAAAPLEWGTRKMPAQPSFYPAYRALKKRFKGRNQRAIRDGLKDAGLSK